MNNNVHQSQGFTIPTEAFREAKCLCGCSVFHRVSRYQFYQGALSQGQLCIAEEFGYKCDSCGSVYGASSLFTNK